MLQFQIEEIVWKSVFFYKKCSPRPPAPLPYTAAAQCPNRSINFTLPRVNPSTRAKARKDSVRYTVYQAVKSQRVDNNKMKR